MVNLPVDIIERIFKYINRIRDKILILSLNKHYKAIGDNCGVIKEFKAGSKFTYRVAKQAKFSGLRVLHVYHDKKSIGNINCLKGLRELYIHEYRGDKQIAESIRDNKVITHLTVIDNDGSYCDATSIFDSVAKNTSITDFTFDYNNYWGYSGCFNDGELYMLELDPDSKLTSFTIKNCVIKKTMLINLKWILSAKKLTKLIIEIGNHYLDKDLVYMVRLIEWIGRNKDCCEYIRMEGRYRDFDLDFTLENGIIRDNSEILLEWFDPSYYLDNFRKSGDDSDPEFDNKLKLV